MTQLRIRDLTRLESLDLKKRYPDVDITFDEGITGDPQHGELVTIAVITATVTGMRALAAWMLKDRSKATIEKTIEIVDDGGTKRVETVRLNVSQSTTDADVVKQLAGLLQVDLGNAADQPT